MYDLFSSKLKIILVLTILICFTGLFSATAQTICDNGTGSQGGYTYEYWKDNGTGCMVLGDGGTFSIEWNNINNLLARKGLRPGSMNQVVNYGATYNPNGNSYLCIYGWTTSPLVEYYIVESWGSWRPPGGEGYMGSVSSDGGSYDIYRTQRVNQPSIQGTATFYQFWSVRTSKKTSGTVTCANHFNAWAGLGMNMGSLYEVSFCVEGYQSSGSADVYSMSMTTGSGSSTTTTTTSSNTTTTAGGSGNITVRARGTLGGEILEIQANGNTVASFTMSTEYADFSTNGSGTIRVVFTNDDEQENGMDIQVDYVDIDGTRYQAEDQATNTGVYVDGACGGSNSEWLHCNGYIEFNTGGGTTTSISTTTSSNTTPIPGNLGDVNGDGSINIVDALLIAQYYVGTASIDTSLADTNCDGTVNIVDALLIAQYYVGLISQFC